MAEQLSGTELFELIQRVFAPKAEETSVAILVDLPDAKIADNPDWRERRLMAAKWVEALRQDGRLNPSLVLYRNAHNNNGDLPEACWQYQGATLPERAEDLTSEGAEAFTSIFARFTMILAPTEFSATAPLKVVAKTWPIRAATMPGFRPEMIPALRLNYTEVNRRVMVLKNLMDDAMGADIRFQHPAGVDELHLDLRFRKAHASGGLLPQPGTAGNLPSGEAYMVPYEGEREPSGSEGILPVQFGSEVVRYRIKNNRAEDVLTQGPESSREAELLKKEPAYANLSELGLGVLAGFGVKACGEVLLDEKLGLHIAFGRSDHFGGQVGPKDFSSPEAVVHIDRVYVPDTQPDVQVLSLDFQMEDGTVKPIMRNGDYVLSWS